MIRVSVFVEQRASDERRDYLYIRIHPGNVLLLLQDPAQRLPEIAATAVRGPVASFRLVLSRPASIIAPSDASVPLRSKRSARLLDSMRLLAQQTILVFYVDQCAISDPDAVRTVCHGFTDGSIKQHPRHDSLRDFYRGRGAAVIEDYSGSAKGGSQSSGTSTVKNDDDDDRDAASPPPYPEVPELPPPSLFAQRSPKKRRRSSEDTSSVLEKRQCSSHRHNHPRYEQHPRRTSGSAESADE